MEKSQRCACMRLTMTHAFSHATQEEAPSFPLVDVPDEELDEDQLKEKKKQKLMKAGHEAREMKVRDASPDRPSQIPTSKPGDEAAHSLLR